MRDPIEELENFTATGTPMTPLPAAEVRRRGDRIRRRNNVLAGAAAVAVVAAIVTPVAVLADRGEPRSVDPAPQTPWVTAVPADFPLNRDMFGEPAVTTRSGIDDITLCDTTVWSPTDPVSTVDLAGARYEENEAYQGRTLALYSDDAAATKALDAIRSGVEGCPRDENGSGLPLVSSQVDTDLGPDSFAFIQRAEDGDLLSDLTAWEVVRSGNALLIDSSYGSAGDDQAVTVAFDLLTERSTVVRAQLCVFSAEPCAQPGVESESPSIGEGAISAIPPDFPLAEGLPSGGLDGRVPSPTPSSCGQDLEMPDVVERTRAQWHTVSEIRDRQLMTFSRQADAQAFAESVVDLYCPVDDLGGDAQRVTATFGGAPTGDFAATVVSHNVVGGQVDRGLVLTQVVRVGRAVLLAQRIDEGFTWPTDVDQRSQELVAAGIDEIGPAVSAMCVFTDQGC